MLELWDLYDINKKKTGVIHERGKEDLIPEGMYHMVVEIWTKNKNNEILITKRHPNKKYGLLWECSTGSVIKGEDILEGAIRELYEETGINATENNMVYLGDTIGKNYIVETYLCILDEEKPELKLQEEEVVDAKFITFDEMEGIKDNMVKSVWNHYNKFKDKILNG